jgi:hypothetical protein
VAADEDNNDDEDEEDTGEANDCNAFGTEDVSWLSVSWAPVAVEVPVAWATAEAWSFCESGLVVCGAWLNDVSLDAPAELAA